MITVPNNAVNIVMVDPVTTQTDFVPANLVIVETDVTQVGLFSVESLHTCAVKVSLIEPFVYMLGKNLLALFGKLHRLNFKSLIQPITACDGGRWLL